MSTNDLTRYKFDDSKDTHRKGVKKDKFTHHRDPEDDVKVFDLSTGWPPEGYKKDEERIEDDSPSYEGEPWFTSKSFNDPETNKRPLHPTKDYFHPQDSHTGDDHLEMGLGNYYPEYKVPFEDNPNTDNVNYNKKGKLNLSKKGGEHLRSAVNEENARDKHIYNINETENIMGNLNEQIDRIKQMILFKEGMSYKDVKYLSEAVKEATEKEGGTVSASGAAGGAVAKSAAAGSKDATVSIDGGGMEIADSDKGMDMSVKSAEASDDVEGVDASIDIAKGEKIADVGLGADEIKAFSVIDDSGEKITDLKGGDEDLEDMLSVEKLQDVEDIDLGDWTEGLADDEIEAVQALRDEKEDMPQDNFPDKEDIKQFEEIPDSDYEKEISDIADEEEVEAVKDKEEEPRDKEDKGEPLSEADFIYEEIINLQNWMVEYIQSGGNPKDEDYQQMSNHHYKLMMYHEELSQEGKEPEGPSAPFKPEPPRPEEIERSEKESVYDEIIFLQQEMINYLEAGGGKGDDEYLDISGHHQQLMKDYEELSQAEDSNGEKEEEKRPGPARPAPSPDAGRDIQSASHEGLTYDIDMSLGGAASDQGMTVGKPKLSKDADGVINLKANVSKHVKYPTPAKLEGYLSDDGRVFYLDYTTPDGKTHNGYKAEIMDINKSAAKGKASTSARPSVSKLSDLGRGSFEAPLGMVGTQGRFGGPASMGPFNQDPWANQGKVDPSRWKDNKYDDEDNNKKKKKKKSLSESLLPKHEKMRRMKARLPKHQRIMSEQFTDNNSIFNSLQDYQNWCKKEGSEGCDENDYKWNAYLAYRQMGPPASTELEPFIKNLIGGDLVAFEAAYDGDGENPLENVASEEQEIEETSRLKSGQLTFPKMAGQKWGKNDLRESIKTKRTINEIVKISKQLQTENRKYKEKNKDYREALKVFRGKLNEVAVFNANLAYSTKLFTDFTTTKKEKINILRRFDNVSTLNESKSLFKQIAGNLNSEVKSLKESVQKTITKTPSGGSSINLIETKTYENPQITRMKDIMSKL